MKKEITSSLAPKAIGPYAQAVRSGNLVFCSGQIGLHPATGEMVTGGVVAETQRILGNLHAVLAAAGATLDDVVRTTIYLTDLADFAAVNEVYGIFFSAPFPARATVGVASLPRGAKVEIDAIAAL